MPVVVEGLGGLIRAFSVADKILTRELKDALREAAEPVRSEAEILAVGRIPRIGISWSRMRVGVTAHSVYIAPRQRGARGGARRRPNLASLLLGRSMEPALEHNIGQVEDELEDMLATVGRAWEVA